MTKITLFAVALACVPAHAAPSLKKATVLRVVQKATPEILACGPNVEEDVVASFTINKDGDVRRLKIVGPHAKDAVGKCMKGHLAALKFPASEGSTPVKYPFRFNASAQAQPAAATAPGKLAQKDLDGLLQVLEGDLKNCGKGSVRTSFRIEPTGKAKDVTVADADDETNECVQKRISRVRFPQAEKPTPVERTFSLGVEEG